MQGIDPFFFGLLVTLIVVFVIVFIASGIRVVKEWERVPVLRLGRFIHVLGPGIIFIVPLLDRIPSRVSLRLQTYDFKTERSLTKDNIPVIVDAVLFYRVVDVEKAVLSVEDYNVATEFAAQTSLRETLGKVVLDELLSNRDTIANHLQEIIDEKTEHWGIKVTSVEIRDVVLPQALQEAMSRQAQAERERRARVILAQAEVEASENIGKAAELYEKSKIAFELRIWNILQEISNNAPMVLLFPANIPTQSFSPISSFALKNLDEFLQKKRDEKIGR
ncbi:MAG: SPFH domain-containing protein [Candidatus Ranarchaeia archaeon]